MIGAAPKAEAGPRFSISFSSGSHCNSGYSYRSYRAPVHHHYRPVYRAPRCYTPPVRCYTPPVRCYTPPVRYYVPRCR